MTDIVLKPCPFCGNSDVYQGIYSGNPVISCQVCEASMGGEEYGGDKQNLIDQWNSRVDEEKSS